MAPFPPYPYGTYLHRRATASGWTSANPVLARGELAFETDTRLAKFGDGATAWNDLLYIESGNTWALVQRATYTLTSTVNEQNLFDAPDTLTLPLGTFEFRCSGVITTLSATSGNAAFDILGPGSAVLGAVDYDTVGSDANTATNAMPKVGSHSIQGQTVASMVLAAIGTQLSFAHVGIFTVTTAGTIIPSVSLVTAAAGVVQVGTHFIARRIGNHTFTSLGAAS